MTGTLCVQIIVIFVFAGSLSAKDEAGISTVRNGIIIYPDNVANPRMPTVPPERRGAAGNCMEAETLFTYQLAPLVSFEKGGSASFSLRDNQRRTAKTILSLDSAGKSLSVVIAPASEGRKVGLALSADKRVTASSYASAIPVAEWVPFTLRWTAAEAVLENNGKAVASLKLSGPFNPQRLSVEVYYVDELALNGDGSFKLDWESGYAATGEAKGALDTLTARLHGFDAMVISQEPPRRDCPMIQVSNASAAEKKIVLRFNLSSEVRGHTGDWFQEILVPAKSSVEVPVKFPLTLDTDIYHLSTRIEGAEMAERDALRNFMFVNRRDEPAGPPKFGFHSFGVSTLGSWPDALPVHWRHNYAYWGYIVGPMWVKDWDGKPGLNPDTPPAEWNWETRVDLSFKEGRKNFVCLISVPYFPWMREKDFDAAYMNKTYPWGKAGGRPNFARYRQFIRALAEHYKGKVDIYELDNESNTVSYSGKPAADYADVMKAAGEEIHATDPKAKVFGICGTSQFVDYIRDAFASGASKYIDGVSWHTYTTPMLPGDAGLPQMLKRANETIAAAGRKLPVMNSETGVYAAPRETFDQPIRHERLAELIKQGVQPVQVPTGWPSYALDEWTAAKSMVQNVTLNFTAGACPFFFFGWDPLIEKGKSWVGNTHDFDCFSIFARVKDGTTTPSLYTLACAVAMAQMEGVLTGKCTPVNQDGITGTIFEKADGGQLAVLWSNGGRRTAMLQTVCPAIEIVSLFGIEKTLAAKGGSKSYHHRIELDDKPIYIHLKKPGMSLSPSPVIGYERSTGKSGETKIKFTLVNRFDSNWTGSVDFSSAEGMKPAPAKIEYSLDPGKRTVIETSCQTVPGMSRGIHRLEAATTLIDGAPFVFPIEIDVRPNFTIPRLPEGFTLKDMNTWKPQGGEMMIDKPEQVAVGRPPELSSLQEERYWQGPDELSAKVAAGYNDKGIFARITVHDKNRGPLKKWPGVEGSCIEWFFDFRSPANGLGSASYDKGVNQIVSKPAFGKNDKVELWNTGSAQDAFKGVEADGGAADASSYWVGIFVPWTALDAKAKTPDSIGFDVGVDGPPAGGVAGRKSQIFLFGGANNNKDASGFGAGMLKK